MENLIGKKFGRLNVVEFVEYSKSGHTGIWLCKCECGKRISVRGNNIKNGHTRSCGCFQDETKGSHSLRHGHTVGRRFSKTYSTWSNMKLRCLNPRNEHYRYYGGQGITICERWMVFDNFLEDMGESPEGLEIDRIDNDKGYFKENCRWVTKIENMRNKRFAIHEYNGKKYTITELAEIIGAPEHALRRRLNQWHLPLSEAISQCSQLRKVGINKRNANKKDK